MNRVNIIGEGPSFSSNIKLMTDGMEGTKVVINNYLPYHRKELELKESDYVVFSDVYRYDEVGTNPEYDYRIDFRKKYKYGIVLPRNNITILRAKLGKIFDETPNKLHFIDRASTGVSTLFHALDFARDCLQADIITLYGIDMQGVNCVGDNPYKEDFFEKNLALLNDYDTKGSQVVVVETKTYPSAVKRFSKIIFEL